VQKVRQSYTCIVELGFCSEGQVGEILDGDKGDTDLPWFKPSSRGNTLHLAVILLLVCCMIFIVTSWAALLSMGRCSHLR